MIDGVILKQLAKHSDERGFFQEVIRSDDDFFREGFGQWSHSVSYTGIIKAFHIHQAQVDWWYVPIGVMKVVLCDMRHTSWPVLPISNKLIEQCEFAEYLLGDNQLVQVLKIPPGVAHGFNVSDEGRIPYDSLGYNWDARDIR